MNSLPEWSKTNCSCWICFTHYSPQQRWRQRWNMLKQRASLSTLSDLFIRLNNVHLPTVFWRASIHFIGWKSIFNGSPSTVWVKIGILKQHAWLVWWNMRDIVLSCTVQHGAYICYLLYPSKLIRCMDTFLPLIISKFNPILGSRLAESIREKKKPSQWNRRLFTLKWTRSATGSWKNIRLEMPIIDLSSLSARLCSLQFHLVEVFGLNAENYHQKSHYGPSEHTTMMTFKR